MKLGFIDFYLDEWHANNYPKWINDASNGEITVTDAFALMDSEKEGGRSTAQWCFDFGIRQSLNIAELIDRVDGIIVLSPDNAEMHEALCQLPLRSGKPVYIDKTFTPDLDTAKRLFDLANKHNTPCYSASALRFAKEYQGLGAVLTLSSRGPGRFETYAVHQVEPALMLMKGKPQKVMGLATGERQTLLVSFEDGRFMDITCFGEGPFAMQVKTDEKLLDLTITSDFFRDFIKEMLAFFKSGEPPVEQTQTLDIMAVLQAGREALRHPQAWITL